jgi:hypothetical protein
MFKTSHIKSNKAIYEKLWGIFESEICNMSAQDLCDIYPHIPYEKEKFILNRMLLKKPKEVTLLEILDYIFKNDGYDYDEIVENIVRQFCERKPNEKSLEKILQKLSLDPFRGQWSRDFIEHLQPLLVETLVDLYPTNEKLLRYVLQRYSSDVAVNISVDALMKIGKISREDLISLIIGRNKILGKPYNVSVIWSNLRNTLTNHDLIRIMGYVGDVAEIGILDFHFLVIKVGVKELFKREKSATA